jgi:hypothetical protein
MPIFDHLSIGVRDIEAAWRFYDAASKPSAISGKLSQATFTAVITSAATSGLSENRKLARRARSMATANTPFPCARG